MKHKMLFRVLGSEEVRSLSNEINTFFLHFSTVKFFATFAMKKLVFLSSSGIYCLSFILGPKRKIILERFAGVRILQLFSGL